MLLVVVHSAVKKAKQWVMKRKIKFCWNIMGLLNNKPVSAFLESYEFLEFKSRLSKVAEKWSLCSFKPLIQSNRPVTRGHGTVYDTVNMGLSKHNDIQLIKVQWTKCVEFENIRRQEAVPSIVCISDGSSRFQPTNTHKLQKYGLLSVYPPCPNIFFPFSLQ